MKTPLLPQPQPRRARAFTLIESLMAVAIFSIGSGILYQSFSASLTLTAKNTALNGGNLGFQESYYRLLTQLESAAAFVDCANYDPATNVLTAVADGNWGNSVRFMRLNPLTMFVLPDDGSGYTVSNPQPPTRRVYLDSAATTIRLSYNPAVNPVAGSFDSSCRLFTTFPQLSGPGHRTASPGTKPGLSFTAANTSVSGIVTLTMTDAIGNSQILDCNRAYFVTESAFIVTTNASGVKTLLYCADTTNPANAVVLCRLLDAGNHTQANDPTIPTGGTAGTFCLATTRDVVQALLPIRSRNALNVMTRRGGAAARNNTWLNANTKFRLRQDL